MIAEQSHKSGEMLYADGGPRIYSPAGGNSVYILFFLSLLMIVAGILLLVFFFSGGEKVRDIQMGGLKHLREENILKIINVKKDQTLSQEEISKKVSILMEHPAIEKAQMKLLLGTLHINVVEKSCVAVLRSGESLYSLFADMRVMDSGTALCHGVPLITGEFDPADGIIRSEVLKRIISGLSLMTAEKPELAHRISEIRIGGKKTSVIVLTDPKLRIEYSGDLTPSLVNRMYAAVSYYEKENQTAGLIDMTGNDAILVPKK